MSGNGKYMRNVVDKHTGMAYSRDEHMSMVGLNDSYKGLGFAKENQSTNPTPSCKASFLIRLNKKSNNIDQ